MAKHEYHEGPDAKTRFEELAGKLFRAPKTGPKPPLKRGRKPKASKASRTTPTKER